MPTEVLPLVTHEALEAAKRHRERLRGECDRVGAFSYSQQQEQLLKSVVRELSDAYKSAKIERRRALSVAKVLRIHLLIHEFCAGSDTPVFVISLVAMTAVASAALGMCMLLSLSVGAGAVSIGISAITAFCCMALFLSWLPVDRARAEYESAQLKLSSLATEVPRCRILLLARQDQLEKLQRALRLKEEYSRAVANEQNIERAFLDQRNLLLLRDWRSLRGIPFEHFLAEIFESLGYRVESTKISGDHGIDLIIEKDGVRIGIQAKGYEDSVGNGAVQEAVSGCIFYQCSRCAVITNSRFTSHAVEHAQGTGCILIDGSRIPDLIAGRVL